MNIRQYSPTPAPGQLTVRAAKAKAHKLGLEDLVLNRNGIWVAFDPESAEQVYVTSGKRF